MAYHFNFFRRYVLTLWGFVFAQTLFIWFIFRWEENLFWERILCWKWLDFLPVCWKEIMSAFAKCSVRLWSTIRCNDMIWSTYHLRDKRAVQFYWVNESALFYGTITNPEGGKRKLGFAKKAQTMHYGRNLAFYNPSFGAWVRVRLLTVESIWSTQPNCELLWT